MKPGYKQYLVGAALVKAFLMILGLVIIVVIAVVLLQKFDRVIGRGSKQVSDGIQASRNVEYRIRCPLSDEKILPLTGDCPFCRSQIKR
jgi:hypothetical protein